MPSAIEYLLPNDRNRDELGGKRERESRERTYNKNYQYYEGYHPKWLIKQPDDSVDDNVTINVTKQAIDRTLSFLFPDMPILHLDPDNVTDDEIWLNEAWRYNGGAYFLSLVAQNGALSGHVYIKVIEPKPFEEYPKLVAMNPRIPITYWQADDPSTVVWHELKWTVGKTELIQDYVNRGNTWEIYEYTRPTGSGEWIQKGETIVWDNPIPPIIDWAHLPAPNEYYGKAEVTQNSIQLNDAINRTASDIGKILRYHASPRTVAIGVESGQVKPGGIENFWTIADPSAKILNLEMQSDLASSVNYLGLLSDNFLAQARVVIMRGTVKDFQRVTNTGIRAVFLDMIAKNELLRWTYGTGIQKLSQAIQFVGDKMNNIKPLVAWSDPLPTDELETVNRMAIEQGSGWLDPIQASKMRGYEWGTVTKNWAAAGKLDFIKTLLLSSGQNKEGGQAVRLGNTNSDAPAP